LKQQWSSAGEQSESRSDVFNSVEGAHQMKLSASTTAINMYSFWRYRLWSVLLGTALTLSWTANAGATTVVYLKWSDSSIVGDSTNAQHPNEVVLTSYSQNDSNPVNLARGAGGSTGKATCGQITIMKQLDRSSPEFLGKVFQGSVSSPTVPVTITFESVAEVPFQFYKVQLYEVAVTSITQNDSQGDTVHETIMLEAGKFRFTYTPQKPDGTKGTVVVFGWDCTRNTRF
jgi:type VI secretion system secreted protein Hcp